MAWYEKTLHFIQIHDDSTGSGDAASSSTHRDGHKHKKNKSRYHYNEDEFNNNDNNNNNNNNNDDNYWNEKVHGVRCTYNAGRFEAAWGDMDRRMEACSSLAALGVRRFFGAIGDFVLFLFWILSFSVFCFFVCLILCFFACYMDHDVGIGSFYLPIAFELRNIKGLLYWKYYNIFLLSTIN